MSNPQCTEARPHRFLWRFALQGASAVLGLVACSQGNVVDLGQNLEQPAASLGTRCQGSDAIDGPIVVESQEQLNELAGCKTINGDLTVFEFPEADLRPLRALTRVEGTLSFNLRPDTPYEPERVWLDSLEGLEGLERVGSLKLWSIAAPSLAPLAGLRWVETEISLLHCPQLSDLEGLENVSVLSDWRVRTQIVVSDCPQLRDITALHLPYDVGLLLVAGTPVERLDASSLTSLAQLTLSGTSLTDLSPFAHLGIVDDDLFIAENNALENATMDGLSYVGRLYVGLNPRLNRLSLESLMRFVSFEVDSNEALVSLPNFAHLEPDPYPFSFGIERNSALQRIELPSAYRKAKDVFLSGNAQLREIAFSGVQTADNIVVTDNPMLSNVDLGALSTANSLEIQRNQRLPPSAFDGVRTFESVITGNAP